MNKKLSLVEHLSDLRRCLIHSLMGILLGFVICWALSAEIFDLVRYPIAPFLKEGGLVFTHPMDKFLAHIKVSLLSGIIVTCPYWIYQIWKFVSPGLYIHEKRYTIGFIFLGSIFFLSGVVFVYFLVLPMALKFLLMFGGGTDSPMITIEEYLSFFVLLTLTFGIAFEMPLILTILSWMGMVDYQFLKEKRRWAFVALAVLAALLTPPDVISMFAMLVPLFILYELSIWMVKILNKAG